MGILLQVQIEGVSTRKDKTFKLILGSQELSNKQAGEIFQLQNSLANCYLSTNAIQTDMMAEVDKVSADMVETIKSPSKRMKAVLYLLWKQDNNGYEDSELYYRNKMEIFIDSLKLKIKE